MAQLKDFAMADIVIVKCDFSGFLGDYAAQTTHGAIITLLNDKDFAKSIFRQTFYHLMKYSKNEMQEMYTQKNQDWKNWCTDLVIYQVARLQLSGKLISIY